MRFAGNSVGSERGFTLVEVAVSGVILAVVIYGLFAFVSQANAIVRNNILRQRAFQEVDRVLASPQFSHDHIDTLYGSCKNGALPYPCNIVLLSPLTRLGVLDERSILDAGDDIIDTIGVFVDTLMCDFHSPSVIQVRAVRVRAGVKWTDYSGNLDSVSLEKVITWHRG